MPATEAGIRPLSIGVVGSLLGPQDGDFLTLTLESLITESRATPVSKKVLRIEGGVPCSRYLEFIKNENGF